MGDRHLKEDQRGNDFNFVNRRRGKNVVRAANLTHYWMIDMLLLRTLTLTGLLAMIAALTGCANIQPKADAFEQQSKRLGIIYTQVNKVTAGNQWNYCNSSRASKQEKAAICKLETNAVQVSWVTKSSTTYIETEAVPNDIKIKAGSIVVLDMTKPLAQRFVSVASVEEHEACKWDGRRNVMLDSNARKFTEFTGVFVAVAAAPVLGVPVLMHGHNDLGGVVCDGWNYQEAYKDKDIDALIDIF